VLVLSCQKSIDTDLTLSNAEPSSVTDVKVVDGVVHIPNRNTFVELVQNLSKEQDKLGDFESKLGGYISMKTVFANLEESDAESIVKNGVTEKYKGFVSVVGAGESQEITRSITDPILATLVNRDGLLVIADEVYKFEYDKFYISKLKNKSLRLGFDVNSADKIGKITHGNSPSSNGRVANSEHCIDEYWVGANKRRMAGDVDYGIFSVPGGNFYTNVTIYTKHQKRVLGTSWWTIDAPVVRFQGSIRVINGNSISYQQIPNQEKFNTGWVVRYNSKKQIK
jgi:hypothetical protein